MVNDRISAKRAIYQMNKQEPFTENEKQKYSKQDRNFIRGIQLTRDVKKKEAIKLFNTNYGEENFIREVNEQWKKDTDQGLVWRDAYPHREVNIKGVKPPIKEPPEKPFKKKKKYTYKFKGLTKVPTSIQNRFKPLGGKSRRYIDKQTGENISRYTRDKRIAKYNQ